MKNTALAVATKTLYDCQKLRIATGNRIVAAFRDKLGIEPSESEHDQGNEKAQAALKILRDEYKRITDGVTKITRHFKSDSKILTDIGEVTLLQGYEQQLKSEEVHQKVLDYELQKYPIYTEYLSKIRGCGILMSAVIISTIDIHKSNTRASIWRYIGTDVLLVMDEETGEIRGEGRCRKKHHLVPKTYTNRQGETVETMGITFNPFIKTKLLGVLGGSFIKQGGKYRDVYVQYKFRLENSPEHQKKTKGHRHNMAVRYMIKRFISDLYEAWREMEGLPVIPPYEEAKLGMEHHYNEDELRQLDKAA